MTGFDIIIAVAIAIVMVGKVSLDFVGHDAQVTVAAPIQGFVSSLTPAVFTTAMGHSAPMTTHLLPRAIALPMGRAPPKDKQSHAAPAVATGRVP